MLTNSLFNVLFNNIRKLGRSGDPIIDGFIFERKLRWIPYDEFKNIEYLDRGGFGTIYKAVWSDKGKEVILKRINNLNENLNEFLNECSHHEKCLWSSEIIFLFGFTKNPETSEYIIVIDYANKGSLRGNLTRIVKYSWKEKLLMLYKTISGLCAMHGQDLVHCDFHDGNILYHSYGKNDEEEEYEEEYEKDVYICDLGLCQPVKSLLKKDDIFGVVPFMAPEVLRGKPCTTASDIYSFSMIMWEFTSGVPPFNDKAHDIQLSLSICKGERPEIIENTPQCYVDLMKKCWNEDPLKRPSASQVMHVFIQWILCPIYAVHEELKNNIMEFMNAPIENNNNLIIEFHPQACYTCRLLEFTSSKVNEILESGNLDDCVINKPSDEDSNMPTAIDNAFDTENEELKKRIKADNSNDNQILKKIKIN
ncbi:hypothetical protein RclHR1_01490025 [Rhizophagus clarus]|uniref:Protein kinase domain-containing protein n=1 Tax=Rhizophagus clarus TaxID=94130 RepID=A0A2Z6QT40_9GLOM|nr:hypothetical protein RclHR1_01490025 [Rhizophagus clarus]